MSVDRLVCVSGDFCSGSTLVFTLFRKTGEYRCLYEPLHEDLHEFLVYGLRPGEQSHHFFVGQYYSEFKGLRRAGALFERRFGLSGLRLDPSDPADGLLAYLRYILDASLARAARVMFKGNRMTFRLGWFRRNFPDVKVVHIHRRPEAQWRSIVRRVQADQGRPDVGQDRVDFNGFSMATWCEDLKGAYPELDAARSRTGFERFSKLWHLSDAENRRHADVSIAYEDLLNDFVPTARRMFEAIGAPAIDVEALRQYVVPPQRQAAEGGMRSLSRMVRQGADKILRRYAHLYAELRWSAQRRA